MILKKKINVCPCSCRPHVGNRDTAIWDPVGASQIKRDRKSHELKNLHDMVVWKFKDQLPLLYILLSPV